MFDPEEARAVYTEGKQLLSAARSVIKSPSDKLQWVMEDLDDCLLDLKQAVIDSNQLRTKEYIEESRTLLRELRYLLSQE